MENKINPHREWKMELIINILDISFDFKWTEFFVVKLVTKSCYFNISS
jgi:hypothetical protein